ncbi:MAG: serine/threonine protein kinase [Candidatus Eisenbacteria bacterium]|uniref:Serine/threonine protein kinase n=1 Tax=Eiseniibacteriota bacterium TaxID=2212470 RepID=A0A538SKF0_UNCEI|nr:MAG: serine/threonine protein kinase [Candidatus Eisenbacteria bacterium]
MRADAIEAADYRRLGVDPLQSGCPCPFRDRMVGTRRSAPPGACDTPRCVARAALGRVRRRMENARVSHYELRHLLGRGGMGEVYEAFDLKAKRPVALKFVAPELAAEPEAFRRFESEALNAAALNHPHIATLYEFEPEGERPFIAMELVAGPSLRDRITAGPLGLQESLEVARDVAAALAYAHRRGIVHRDIKPENLMFDEEGRIKVMDFGLARALMASRLTLTGSSLGTPSYMSPESAQQGSAGTPSDVFALGLVLSEMLTGQQTFHGDSPLAVMYAIVNAAPPPLRQ